MDEAYKRWPDNWDTSVERMTVLLMMKREARGDIERHGFFVEHIHPVFTIFYRPRNEAPLLKKNGFNHLDASFQFINLAITDLGKWMNKYVGELAFEKYEMEITPIPIGYKIPMKRQFEVIKTLCFKDSELQKLTQFHLSMPPNSLVGKSFISIPEKVLDKPIEVQEEQIEKTTKEPEQSVNITEDKKVEETMPEILKEITTSVVANAQVPTPQPGIPQITPEPEDAPSDTPEGEFRRLVKWMISLGHEPSEIMEMQEFQEVSERAIAAGVNTWELFIKLTS